MSLDDEAQPPHELVAAQTPSAAEGSSPEEAAAVNLSEPPQSTTSTISKFLKGKQREWDAVTHRPGPLALLDLPVDILRLIVKEITHTNDLTALALANSTLHNLAIPHIYARFDIVWPDAHLTSTDPKSVDALTYGLSTLCLGSAFARTMQRLRKGSVPPGRFKGNEYAKYTRKFSLGNGPSDWVAEYLVSKESGKMLGTLVALALDKMVNLESFVWDMPTGVLSDTFMALGSLPEHHPNNECKLEKVWVRWHDNSETAGSPSPSVGSAAVPAAAPNSTTHQAHLTPVGVPLPSASANVPLRRAIKYSQSTVEYPTFSVLPPLRSLTVLNIDELAYLDEMSVLIERSKNRLQELRVGISARAARKDFVEAWDGAGLQQVDHRARWPGESTIGDKRLGGVLGVLVGRIYDIRRRNSHKDREVARPGSSDTALSNGWSYVPGPSHTTDDGAVAHLNGTDGAGDPSSESSRTVAAPGASSVKSKKQKFSSTLPAGRKPEHAVRPRLDGKLKLHTLELERVPLSMQVCTKAIDWTLLNNLIILDCPHHEALWRVLKKQFQPSPMSSGFGISANSRPAPNGAMHYHLNLKRIHTDLTSAPLINFIRETLAPNSLEVLFLQDRRRTTLPPSVTIEALFKAVKRHRSSLRKLLLDSSAKSGHAGNSENARWKNWVLTPDMMLYVCSGRMASLSELAISFDYKDWHVFLQRLRNMPQLRSLNIPNIADCVTGAAEPKDLAMHIVDIITLCPEIQLCYVGIASKCFEILESRPFETNASSRAVNGDGATGGGADMSMVAPHDGGDDADQDDTTDEDNDEDDDEEETDDDADAEAGEDAASANATDPDATQSEDEGAGGQDSDDEDSIDGFVDPDMAAGRVRLRLREILFYDDKVAIFKARHARL